MEFPECFEEHLYQVVKHLIDKTRAELQELYRHHWKSIPGNHFWNVEIGSELWRSCHTQLKPRSKHRIVKGRISTWSIADLVVLLPEVMHRSGNSSLAKRYSEGLNNVSKLFTQFDTDTESCPALSREQYKRFKASLTVLLTRLDTDTMTLSNITRNLISVEDLTQAVASLMSITRLRNTCGTNVISRVTELLEKFLNLPPYFEEAMYKLRYKARAGTPCNRAVMFAESLKLLNFDRSNTHAHVNLSHFYYESTTENPSLHLYHSRKHRSLQPHRAHLFHFIKTYTDQQPNDNPSVVQLLQGLQLMLKPNLPVSLNEHYSAMGQFKRASQLGNPFGLYAQCLVAILIKDYYYDPQRSWSEMDNVSFQKAVTVLTTEVTKTPQFYKYGSCQLQNEKLSQAHFLLGYLYEKGFLPRDYDKAKQYYQTAVTVYNNEIASYNLGSMYYDGAGVRRSYMWAKLYWQHSIPKTKREWPMLALLDYYLKHLSFTNAQTVAKHMGTVEPQTGKNSQITTLVRKLEEYKWKCSHLGLQLKNLNVKLALYEKKWKLSSKGLTYLERLKRVELLGFVHEFGDAIKETYDFFKLSYGTERNGEGDGGTMSTYVHGLDESLEVDYSQLFSRLYLVSPSRLFTVTTFRHNFALATDPDPKFSIHYKTQSHAELLAKYPTTFREDYPSEHFTVVEDVLFAKDAVCLIIEDITSGNVHQLKLKLPKLETVMRVERHLVLEYGAQIILSYKGNRSWGGNVDAYFDQSLAHKMEVFVMGKVANMCRFCCESILQVKECVCGFRYCGQTCLEKDRKYLKHEFLCSAST